MISLVWSALGIYKYLIIAALAAAAYWFVWDTGRDFERGRWETKMSAEVSRQQDITDEFRALSESLAEQLLSSNEQRESILRRLQREARDAPDADACGLGASSVMRLNNLNGSPEVR